jgi:putative phosphoesterase
MRILLVSDIHANRPALEAIREQFDVCFCLGDLVDYGVEPAPCIEWVRTHATHSIRGNHDHGVAQGVRTRGVGGFRYLTGMSRLLTARRISSEQRRYLGSLPISRMVTLDGVRYLLVHATPRDPMDEYGSPDPDFWARRLENVPADVICVGHTHIPFTLEVGNQRVINPGSVGLPRDGDPRAGYAIIEDGQVTLKRIDYPIDEAVASVQASPLPTQARRLLEHLYRHGELPRRSEEPVVPQQKEAV